MLGKLPVRVQQHVMLGLFEAELFIAGITLPKDGGGQEIIRKESRALLVGIRLPQAVRRGAGVVHQKQRRLVPDIALGAAAAEGRGLRRHGGGLGVHRGHLPGLQRLRLSAGCEQRTQQAQGQQHRDHSSHVPSPFRDRFPNVYYTVFPCVCQELKTSGSAASGA